MAVVLAVLLLSALFMWARRHQNRSLLRAYKRATVVQFSRKSQSFTLTYTCLCGGQYRCQTLTFSAPDMQRLYAVYPDPAVATQRLRTLVYQQPGQPPRWYIAEAIAQASQSPRTTASTGSSHPPRSISGSRSKKRPHRVPSPGATTQRPSPSPLSAPSPSPDGAQPRQFSIIYERIHRGQRHRHTIRFSPADLRRIDGVYPNPNAANRCLRKLVYQYPNQPPRWYVAEAIARKRPSPLYSKPKVEEPAPQLEQRPEPFPAASPPVPESTASPLPCPEAHQLPRPPLPPPPPPRPRWLTPPQPDCPPASPPPALLLACLDRLTGNREVTNRLVAAVAKVHPHRSSQWHGEKVLWDLERDRQS